MAVRVQRALLSDKGRSRVLNQDYCDLLEPTDPQELERIGRLFVVADGMGGQDAGSIPSLTATRFVLERYRSAAGPDLGQNLLEAIQAANTEVKVVIERNQWSNAGTTLVATVLRDAELIVANVGDSRAYLIRNGTIRQITEDHSWVAEEIRAGRLTPEEARAHPRRSAITRALGTRPSVEVDLFRQTLQPGDAVVLCTDGLSGPVRDEEIADIVLHTEPQKAVRQLVEMANHRGGPDNISTIVIRYGGRALLRPGTLAPRLLLGVGAVGALAGLIFGGSALLGGQGFPLVWGGGGSPSEATPQLPATPTPTSLAPYLPLPETPTPQATPTPTLVAATSTVAPTRTPTPTFTPTFTPTPTPTPTATPTPTLTPTPTPRPPPPPPPDDDGPPSR